MTPGLVMDAEAMMSLEGRETIKVSSLCAGHTRKTPAHTFSRLSRLLSLGQTREAQSSHGSLSLPDNYTVLFTISGFQ